MLREGIEKVESSEKTAQRAFKGHDEPREQRRGERTTPVVLFGISFLLCPSAPVAPFPMSLSDNEAGARPASDVAWKRGSTTATSSFDAPPPIAPLGLRDKRR